MAENDINKPREQSEAERMLTAFQTSVEQAIEKSDPVVALKAIVELSAGEKGIPEKAVKALQGLDQAKKDKLTVLLTTEDIEGVTKDSRDLLRSLAEKITPGAAPEFAKKTAAEKMLEFIDKKVDGINADGKIDQKAKQYGFEGGDATKWLKNFFTGMAAKVLESIAFSFKSFNSNIDGMLKTPLLLRIHQLEIKGDINHEGDDANTFKKAYMKRAREVTKSTTFRPPESLDDAKEILLTPVVQPAVAEAQKPRTKIQIQEGDNDKPVKTGFKGTKDMLFSKKDNVVSIRSEGKKLTLDKKVSAVEVLEATDKDDAVILFTLLDDRAQVKVLASSIKPTEKIIEGENTQTYQKTPISITVA